MGRTYGVIHREHLEVEFQMAEAAFDLVALTSISTLSLSISMLFGEYVNGLTDRELQTAAGETIPAHRDVVVTDSPVPQPRMNL